MRIMSPTETFIFLGVCISIIMWRMGQFVDADPGRALTLTKIAKEIFRK